MDPFLSALVLKKLGQGGNTMKAFGEISTGGHVTFSSYMAGFITFYVHI